MSHGRVMASRSVRNIAQDILEFELDTPVQWTKKWVVLDQGVHLTNRILVDNVDTRRSYEVVTSLALARVPVTHKRLQDSHRSRAAGEALPLGACSDDSSHGHW